MDATIIMPKMPSAGNYGENFNESEQYRASQLKPHIQSVKRLIHQGLKTLQS